MAGHVVFPASCAVVVLAALMHLHRDMERDLRLRRIRAADRDAHREAMAEVVRLIREMEAAGVPSPSDFAAAAAGVRH